MKSLKLAVVLGVIISLFANSGARAQGVNPLEITRLLREITPVTLVIYQIHYLPSLDTRSQTRFSSAQARALIPELKKLAVLERIAVKDYQEIGSAINKILSTEQEAYYSTLVKQGEDSDPPMSGRESRLLIEYYQANSPYNPFAPSGFAHDKLRKFIRLLEERAK